MLLWVGPSPLVFAFDLIRPEEAARPDDRYEEGDRPGPILGPRITVFGELKTTSPFELTIHIEPRGSARVNLDSLRLTYRKTPAVNLTPRIRPFIDASARTVVIRIREARAPVGKHQLLLQVVDTLDVSARKALDLEVQSSP
jgi:hypothetical protein